MQCIPFLKKKILLTTFIILRWKSEYWGKGKSHGVQSIHTEFYDLKCSISLRTYFSFNSRQWQYDQEQKTNSKYSSTVIEMVFQTQKAESIIYYQCGKVEIAWLSPEVWKAEAIFHYAEVLMSLVVEWEDMMLNSGVIDSSPDSSTCWKSICSGPWWPMVANNCNILVTYHLKLCHLCHSPVRTGVGFSSTVEQEPIYLWSRDPTIAHGI